MNKAHMAAAGTGSVLFTEYVADFYSWLGEIFPWLHMNPKYAAAFAGLTLIMFAGGSLAAVPGDKDGDGIPDDPEPNTATTVSTTKTNETVPLPQPPAGANP